MTPMLLRTRVYISEGQGAWKINSGIHGGIYSAQLV